MSPVPCGPTDPADGRLEASIILAAADGRNSIALRTASGTFWSLIDSIGGGAAGKGEGTEEAIWADRLDRPVARDRLEDDIGKGLGGDTKLIEARLEMLETEEAEGEGGAEDIGEDVAGPDDFELEPAGKLPNDMLDTLLDVSRPRALSGLPSPLERRRPVIMSSGVTGELARLLARPPRDRIRGAFAVRAWSCSGLPPPICELLGPRRCDILTCGRGVAVASSPREFDEEPGSGRPTIAKVGDMSMSERGRLGQENERFVTPKCSTHLRTTPNSLVQVDCQYSHGADQTYRPIDSNLFRPHRLRRSRRHLLRPCSVHDPLLDQTLAQEVKGTAVWSKGARWKVARWWKWI